MRAVDRTAWGRLMCVVCSMSANCTQDARKAGVDMEAAAATADVVEDEVEDHLPLEIAQSHAQTSPHLQTLAHEPYGCDTCMYTRRTSH